MSVNIFSGEPGLMGWKPRRQPFPRSFYEAWSYTNKAQWDWRILFERFYIAGMEERMEVLADLYREATEKMELSPEMHKRVKFVLGEKTDEVRSHTPFDSQRR